MMNNTIQEKWKQGFLPGYDCIAYADGSIVIANTYSAIDTATRERKQFWFPLCDTTLEGIQKYDDDIWTEVDIFHGAITYNDQKIVFGDGGMGNEGYVASTNSINGDLIWAIFFTFSNPICRAEIKNEHLICYGDSGTIIEISLNEITKIRVTYEQW